jgi:two-component system chemotaxis response regulator CheY
MGKNAAEYFSGERGAVKTKKQIGFFRSVKALPDYRLEVEMQTDTRIVFDFNSRLGTMRFGALKDAELFNTVHTDGDFILFGKEDAAKVKISPSDFMDLILVDRTGQFPDYG